MKDLYVDIVLGAWQYNKKQSNKEYLCYTRKGEIKLHKDNAVMQTDPKDHKEYKIYGDIILTEKKLVNISTSEASYFRGVEMTETSKKDAVIV